ncbi:MAG: hypothetical protein RSD28_07130, partial [Lachnospiraceae bacterium]
MGLANIALTESSFEKNSLDPYEIITLLNNGYSLANAKGKQEMCFAAAGIMASVHIGRKPPQIAYDLVADLGSMKKAYEMKKRRISDYETKFQAKVIGRA